MLEVCPYKVFFFCVVARDFKQLSSSSVKNKSLGLNLCLNHQVFDDCWGLKEELNINIPTKERIANLDIFLYFIKNLRKFTKLVLTAVAE